VKAAAPKAKPAEATTTTATDPGQAAAPPQKANSESSVVPPVPTPKAAASQAMIDAFAKAAKEQSLLEPHVSTLPPMPTANVKLLPREIDIFLLTVARRSVGRSLYEDEKRALRDAFKKLL